MESTLTIGMVSERAGVATSALRYYEAEGLIHADRTPSGQRRYPRDVLRRVSFIRIAQRIGLSLDEIRDALHSLPDNRTPTEGDWQRLSSSWRPRIEAQIRMLQQLQEGLESCIGCGCLSLKVCKLVNPDDMAAEYGPGPRVLDED